MQILLKAPIIFSRLATQLTVLISLSILTTTSLAEETPETEQIEDLGTEVMTQPSDQKIKVTFKKEPGTNSTKKKDTKPPEIKIRFKEGYKKGSISERPNRSYKRSIYIEIPSDLSEQEQNTIITKKCENYNDAAKPNYFVSLRDKKTQNAIKTLSCEEAGKLISEK